MTKGCNTQYPRAASASDAAVIVSSCSCSCGLRVNSCLPATSTDDAAAVGAPRAFPRPPGELPSEGAEGVAAEHPEVGATRRAIEDFTAAPAPGAVLRPPDGRLSGEVGSTTAYTTSGQTGQARALYELGNSTRHRPPIAGEDQWGTPANGTLPVALQRENRGRE